MKHFRDQYRIPSARLQSWDYRRSACYFVTLCTKEKECCLGEVVEGQMILSPIGKIEAEEWQKTPHIRPNVGLDEWRIMPNHLHGIVVINDVETPRRGVSKRETFRRNVSTGQRPRLKSGSLSSIIGQFKSVSTKRIRSSGFPDFAWQPRFYDHIIRSRESLEKIRDYIRHNPHMWSADKENIENLRL